MSEITGYIKELEEINKEIRRCASELKKMKERKIKVENNILKILEERDLSGAKYKNIVVMKEDGKSRIRKNKNEKLKDGSSVLKEHGIDKPEEVLDRIMNAMKGKETLKYKLKMRMMK